MISESDRLRAAAAYCFLGWLFLIARGNADFQSPYVRSHARKSLLVNGGFLIIFALVAWTVAPIVTGIIIPVIGLPLSRIITTGTFLALTVVLVLIAYRAYGGMSANEVFEQGVGQRIGALWESGQSLSGDAKLWVVSLVPLIGSVLALRSRDPFFTTQATIGSLWTLALFTTLSLGSSAGSLFFIVSIALVAHIMSAIVAAIASGKSSSPACISHLPKHGEWWPVIRGSVKYLWVILLQVVGKGGDEKTWKEMVTREVSESYKRRSEDLTSPYTTRLPLWLLAVPIVNIIMTNWLTKHEISKAVLQGLLLSIITVTVAVIYGTSDVRMLWLTLPVIWTLGHTLGGERSYHLPILWELADILLSLWRIAGRKKSLVDANRDIKSVTLSLQDLPK